jgi:diguanylate cyclase (GGDEF)-like protein
MHAVNELNTRRQKPPWLLPLLATFGFGAIFLFDLSTPLGVAGGVPYILIVLFGLLARQPVTVLVLAVISTLLTLAGLVLSPAAILPIPVVALNRGLAIFAIWATAIVSYLHLRSLAELKPLADHDELTGLYNRHYLQAESKKQISIARRYHQPLSLLMIDIDHFKQINDRHGHLAGDEVLRTLAGALMANCRDIDTACRYGGEEFVVLLLFTGLDGALATARQVHTAVAALEVPWRGETIRFRVSMGLAELTPGMTVLEDLVAAADAALYTAKQGGRDRIMSAPGAG